MSDKSNPYAQGYGQSWGASTGTAQPAAKLDGATPPDLVRDTTTQGFAADVIAESRKQPVLVDFWAPWCGPCRQLTPIIEKVVRAAKGRVKLVKMNIDDHPAIPGQLGIQSIPAVVAFVDGKPVDGFMGALPESQVTAFIDRVAGPDAGAGELVQALEAASAAIAAGEPGQAAQIYQMILQSVPDNADALGGLAGLLADAGEVEDARAVLAQASPEAAKAPAIVAARAKLELAEKVAALGDVGAFNARLARDEDDHEARFSLAQIENARGNREAAADHLLKIMRKDRAWNDDGARKQLVQFFEAWGPKDPATVSARRKLSSLLFS